MTETPKIKKNWRSRYPLASFDPRIPALLKKAVLHTADKPIKITFNLPKDCYKFQQRLYQFRGRAREDKHEEWEIFCRSHIIKQGNTLLLFAQDSQYNDAFAQAGLVEDEEHPVSITEGDLFEGDLDDIFNPKDKDHDS
jgi:hypothetical protein